MSWYWSSDLIVVTGIFGSVFGGWAVRGEYCKRKTRACQPLSGGSRGFKKMKVAA